MGGYHVPERTAGFLLTEADYQRAKKELEKFQVQDEPILFITHGPPRSTTKIDYVLSIKEHVGDDKIKEILDGDLENIVNFHGHIHEGGRHKDEYNSGFSYNIAAITPFNNPLGPNTGLITINDGKVSYKEIK